MKIKFKCGLCGKKQILALTDPNKVYLIGAKKPDSSFPKQLDAELCAVSPKRGEALISGIQAHIKYKDNQWRIYDGIPKEYDENIAPDKKKNPFSIFGTFIKRNKEFSLISRTSGIELKKNDSIFFVPSPYSKNKYIQSWSKELPEDILNLWRSTPKSKAKLFEGFKYTGKVIDDTKTITPAMSRFSKNVKINGENINYCTAIDIVGFTNITKEEQPIVISEFNHILDRLLKDCRDYICIPVGDGIYLNLLGRRESHDEHVKFALDFIENLRKVNESRVKPWHVRIALTHGYDTVMTVKLADTEMVNVYGNCINTTARLLSNDDKKESEQSFGAIVVGTTTHQEIHNMEYYKLNFSQEPGTIIDKHKKEHYYYIYKRKIK